MISIHSFLAPPLEPRAVEIFDITSDELSVKWKPSEDSDAFKVEQYIVQHRKLKVTAYADASFPATEGKDTYSYRIKDLEPETTYMVRVGAKNKYDANYVEAQAHKTSSARKWFFLLH